jgi:hypothetical protein
VGKAYAVLGVLASAERGILLQLFSDDHVSAFFAARDFEIVDGAVSDHWRCTLHNGALEIGFPSLLRRGFWEDFFEGSEEARLELQRIRVQFFGGDQSN